MASSWCENVKRAESCEWKSSYSSSAHEEVRKRPKSRNCELFRKYYNSITKKKMLQLTQTAYDAIITLLWRQNDVVWRHNDVIFASYVRWVHEYGSGTHWGEAMYISLIDFQWYHTKNGLNDLIIHNLIMITCIRYGITFAISLPKLINVVPL